MSPSLDKVSLISVAPVFSSFKICDKPGDPPIAVEHIDFDPRGFVRQHGGVERAGDFHGAVLLEHMHRLGKNIADENRRHRAQRNRSRHAARRKIIQARRAFGRAFGRDIVTPGGIHDHGEHIVAFLQQIGDFVMEWQVTAEMLRQGVTVEHGGRADHDAVKIQKDSPMLKICGHLKMAAIDPDGLPFLHFPTFPGKFRDTMRQRDRRERGIGERRLVGAINHFAAEKPALIQ